MKKRRNTPANPAMRIIDANLNRCREALRVVEDVFRLGFSEAEASKNIKKLRHKLADVARELVPDGLTLLSARDSAGDVGRGVRAPRQRYPYSRIAEMTSANLKRAQEAARVLEETARLTRPRLAASLERLRFDLYEVERRYLPRLLRRGKLENVLLYSLVTKAIAPQPVPEMVRALIDGGVDAIQLREKIAPDDEFARSARKVAALCRRSGVLFIVNDRADIAVAVGADGVHVGREDLSPAQAREVVGESGIVGVSTRSLALAKNALADGADYVAIGPVFESRIAPDKEPIGVKAAGSAAKKLDAPVFAIGGISESLLESVLDGGCRRVAACTALMWAKNPTATARKFKRALVLNSKKQEASNNSS